MILKVFSVFDSKIEAYMTPFFMTSKGQAIRSLCDTAQSPDSMFFKHPGDFTLFELGEYDDASATFNLHNTPFSLGVLIELLPVK